MVEKNVNEIQPFIKIGLSFSVIGYKRPDALFIDLGQVIGYCFDGHCRPTNQHPSLRAARAQGKTDRAINEKLSQVLWVGRSASVCQRTGDYTTIGTFFVDILTAFF